MRCFTVAATCLFLAGCGFHLKGAQVYDNLPVRNWYVSGGDLQQQLESALRRADGLPVAAKDAQASLVVNSVDEKKAVWVITRAALINEYLLVLDVKAEVVRDGKSEPVSVLVRRRLEYADSEVLGKQEEEAMIWREMREEAAQQLVRRLAFPKFAAQGREEVGP
ncbi:MAG: LPS assembly lipoprotein LptE [Neisseria sp.]|nr:LPS assembly lipoprotein LptE [Neisseria sp.]